MEPQVINKKLDIDIAKFDKLEDAIEATDKRFRELNPEPVRPQDTKKYKRSQMVKTGAKGSSNPGYVWITVFQDRTPSIRLNQKDLTGSDTIELEELETLIKELNQAKSNYSAAKELERHHRRLL